MSGGAEVSRSIVVAADVQPMLFSPLALRMKGIAGVSAIKIGLEVAYGIGLQTATEIVHTYGMQAVFDHQKAGTDIPATGAGFANVVKHAGVDAAIMFPFAGPNTQREWTRALQDSGVQVITGAEMTHADFLADASGRHGGYVHPASVERILSLAVELGVHDYMAPGNQPERVQYYREFLDREVGVGAYTLWASGFITQGGDLTETGRLAGPRFNAIVGSGIYDSRDPRQTATDLGQKILQLNATG